MVDGYYNQLYEGRVNRAASVDKLRWYSWCSRMVKQLVLFYASGSLRIFNGIDARIKRSWIGNAIRRIQESRRVLVESCEQETEDDRCEQMRMAQWNTPWR